MGEIRAELETVLGSRAFRQSRGLAKLLRYICGRALVSSADPITEYTIAVDVLGKPADFKESKEANVRVEVHRLRKRLAQYYEEEGASHRVRIVIPTGQYTPQFITCGETALEAAPRPLAPSEPERPTVDVWPAEHRPSLRLGWIVAAIVLLTALAVGAGLARTTAREPEPLEAFWQPIFASSNPVLLCIGDLEGGIGSKPGLAQPDAALTVNEYHNSASQMVNLADAATATRLAGLLQSKGKSFRLASQSDVTFADLQSGPAVLIGLLNNDWTSRLLEKVRFTVERRARRITIRDREQPQRNDWSIDYSTPVLELSQDYALVLRLVDPKTEQMVVSAAGISVFGTLAAGEFLTNPTEIRKLAAIAPKDWRRKNLELVLSTEIIRGKSGRAHIVAAHFW